MRTLYETSAEFINRRLHASAQAIAEGEIFATDGASGTVDADGSDHRAGVCEGGERAPTIRS